MRIIEDPHNGEQVRFHNNPPLPKAAGGFIFKFYSKAWQENGRPMAAPTESMKHSLFIHHTTVKSSVRCNFLPILRM